MDDEREVHASEGTFGTCDGQGCSTVPKSVYQNKNAFRKFENKDETAKYEAEVMAMLHDEQCSSASDDDDQA